VPDDFHIGTADRRIVHAQHRLSGPVGHLQTPAAIDDEHAFDHAGKHRIEACAVAEQLVDPIPQLARGNIRGGRGRVEVLCEEGRNNRGADEDGDERDRDGQGHRHFPGREGDRGDGDERDEELCPETEAHVTSFSASL
jgi:hypothetical protein